MGLISNGTTIFDNGSMASGFGGDLTFISKATASSSASIEFSLGNYKEYQFYFVNIHPQTTGRFQFNLSTDNGSNYNVTKTSTYYAAYHSEVDDAGVAYSTGSDLAQSTSDQPITEDSGADNDQAISGFMSLFNPSSTTYVKHYMSNMSNAQQTDYSQNIFSTGYANTTSALTNIRFKFASGNIDAGEILLFGVN